jgi:hypothetical protein
VLTVQSTADVLLKRVRRRAEHIERTADYICALERVVDAVIAVLPTPGFIREHDDVVAAAPGCCDASDGAVVVAKDATGNIAVLWRHNDAWDLIVSVSPAFGDPVAIRGIGLIRGYDDDATPQPLQQRASA